MLPPDPASKVVVGFQTIHQAFDRLTKSSPDLQPSCLSVLEITSSPRRQMVTYTITSPRPLSEDEQRHFTNFEVTFRQWNDLLRKSIQVDEYSIQIHEVLPQFDIIRQGEKPKVDILLQFCDDTEKRVLFEEGKRSFGLPFRCVRVMYGEKTIACYRPC